MDEKTRNEMNEKLDILCDQIEQLEGENKAIAIGAMKLWKSAKTQEHLGLGPMETRHVYHKAYTALMDLGLNVDGMIKPYLGA